MASLPPPRIVDAPERLIAGLGGHFTFDNLNGLPALWQRFRPMLGRVPGQVGPVAYGVCYNTDEAGHFDYIAGVEVADFADLTEDLARLPLSPQQYAVFWHTEHVTALRGTFEAIFNEWLPSSGYQSAEAPPFERYDERFDPATGLGGLEVWIPVRT